MSFAQCNAKEERDRFREPSRRDIKVDLVHDRAMAYIALCIYSVSPWWTDIRPFGNNALFLLVFFLDLAHACVQYAAAFEKLAFSSDIE